MNILVVNCGSSSVKYRLFDMRGETVLATGEAERIGEHDSRLVHRWRDAQGGQQERVDRRTLPDHRTALETITAALREPATAQALGDLHAVGHRVVHGGDTLRTPARITGEVRQTIAGLCELAPLHNPVNLTGIDVCLELFPEVPQVAVFDTAFHQGMPEYARRYAVPDDWYQRHGVRRYGFQGTSHAFVARQAAQWLQREPDSLKLVSLHLGSGASAAAIRGGRCLDTSMGFTPLEGLMMGTRSGDIDPAIPAWIAGRTGAAQDALYTALNRDSGLKGICGASDLREIERRYHAGDSAARLALEMYTYRIRKYIGAYSTVLGGPDALVFTAGVGEHSSLVRQLACEGLDWMGVILDDDRNKDSGQGIQEIQADTASVRVLVIPTNEELEIARQSLEYLQPA